MSHIDIRKLFLSILAPLMAGAIGSIATATSIPTWYAELVKPEFNPPNWVFGPVWTVLYLFMGIALYLVWTTENAHPDKQKGIQYFWIQLALNLVWSLMFFGLRSLEGGVLVIVTLLLYIILTMRSFRKISQTAFYLFVPYILWVAFATVLNISLLMLN